MPKLKTNKGIAKRVKVTKNGKIKRNRPGRRHLLSHKSSQRRRKLRSKASVVGKLAKSFAASLYNQKI